MRINTLPKTYSTHLPRTLCFSQSSFRVHKATSPITITKIQSVQSHKSQVTKVSSVSAHPFSAFPVLLTYAYDENAVGYDSSPLLSEQPGWGLDWYAQKNNDCTLTSVRSSLLRLLLSPPSRCRDLHSLARSQHLPSPSHRPHLPPSHPIFHRYPAKPYATKCAQTLHHPSALMRSCTPKVLAHRPKQGGEMMLYTSSKTYLHTAFLPVSRFSIHVSLKALRSGGRSVLI